MYNVRFKFGKENFIAVKRAGKTPQEAENSVKDQCRIANLAKKTPLNIEIIETISVS